MKNFVDGMIKVKHPAFMNVKGWWNQYKIKDENENIKPCNLYYNDTVLEWLDILKKQGWGGPGNEDVDREGGPKKKRRSEGEREATPCYLGTGRRGRGKGGLNRSERAISSNAGTLPEGTRQDLRDENRASAAREVGSSDDRGVSSVAVTTRADPPQAWQAAKREPRPARRPSRRALPPSTTTPASSPPSSGWASRSRAPLSPSSLF